MGKAVFYGDKYRYEYYEYLLPYVFSEYRFVPYGSEPDLKEDEIVYICPPRHLSPSDTDRYQKEAAETIKRNCIFPEQYEKEVNRDKYLRLGKANPDKTFFIIHGQDPKSGWGNIILRVLEGIGYAKENGLIPIIDMKNIKNQYISEKRGEIENAWDNYFIPLNEYTLEEVYESQNVILCGNYGHNAKPVSAAFLRFNSFTQFSVENEYLRLGLKGKVFPGAVYRGTDYYKAYNHPDPPKIEDFIQSIREKYEDSGYETIFLATEIQEVVDIMERAFPDRIRYVDQMRYSENERRYLADIHFNRERDSYKKGLEYLKVLWILSRSKEIYGYSNATTECAKSLREMG